MHRPFRDWPHARRRAVFIVLFFHSIISSTACTHGSAGGGASAPPPISPAPTTSPGRTISQGPSTVTPPQAAAPAKEGGGGAGDAGGGENSRPSFEDIRKVVAELANDEYQWALRPLRGTTYYTREQPYALRTPSPQLKKMLGEIENDLLDRGEQCQMGRCITEREWPKFVLKEKGGCESEFGDKEGSAPKCDLDQPICLSLEYIREMTPKNSLVPALHSLVMHELSHQHCADEPLAKEVETYFDQDAVKNSGPMTATVETFREIFQDLQSVDSALDGYESLSGIKLHDKKTISDAYLCSNIGRLHGEVKALSYQLKGLGLDEPLGPMWLEGSGFPNSSQFIENAVRAMTGFCGEPDSFYTQQPVGLADRPGLRIQLFVTITTFDLITDRFAQVTGVLVQNFSDQPGP